MPYSPFKKPFAELTTANLEVLCEVHEGWYVEYKSQIPTPKSLAKSLASFANQHGGWLFIGIDEDSATRKVARFSGVEDANIQMLLDRIRNAAKDIISPHVEYQEKVFVGPDVSLGLSLGRSIVSAYIPEGPNTPYVHNDGRIYVRVGDSSTPYAATDKATFDMLYKRGEEKRSYLKSTIERSPTVSEGEREDQPYVHLSILSDPYGVSGFRYNSTFSESSSVMKAGGLPFDNIFSAPGGYVARQLEGNDFSRRLFTWEISPNGNSFVTVPLQKLQIGQNRTIVDLTRWQSPWSEYGCLDEFFALVPRVDSSRLQVLNLNQLLILLGAIIDKHHRLVAPFGFNGQVYVKARLENVWRSLPFVDVPEYLSHIREFGIPIVQDDDFLAPPGSALETFVEVPLSGKPTDEGKAHANPATAEIWSSILTALGIPSEMLLDGLRNLISVALRETK